MAYNNGLSDLADSRPVKRLVRIPADTQAFSVHVGDECLRLFVTVLRGLQQQRRSVVELLTGEHRQRIVDEDPA